MKTRLFFSLFSLLLIVNWTDVYITTASFEGRQIFYSLNSAFKTEADAILSGQYSGCLLIREPLPALYC